MKKSKKKKQQNSNGELLAKSDTMNIDQYGRFQSGMIDPICFIELESSDPDPSQAQIVEISVTLVTGNLKLKYFIGNYLIKTDIANIKNENIIDRFTKSGLLQELKTSDRLVTLEEAEEQIIKKLEDHDVLAKSMPSAGIQAYKDRLVLERMMPKLDKFLSFTIIDVSSIDEVAQRWNKQVYTKSKDGGGGMRAEARVLKAIERMKYYKERLFKSK